MRYIIKKIEEIELQYFARIMKTNNIVLKKYHLIGYPLEAKSEEEPNMEEWGNV